MLKRQCRAIIHVTLADVHMQIECIEPTVQFCKNQIEKRLRALSPLLQNPGDELVCRDIGLKITTSGRAPIDQFTWLSETEVALQNIEKKIAELAEANNSGAKKSLKWNMRKKHYLEYLLDAYIDIYGDVRYII